MITFRDKMRAALTFLIALLVFSITPLSAQEMPGYGPSFTCGLTAAYVFLNKAGHHVPYGELMRQFQDQAAPDSLLAIKNVLAEHGCATIGVKTDADFFLSNKGPAIVHLQLSGYSPRPENHFTYLVGASRQTGAEVLDPVFNVRAAAYISWGTFSQSFQGSALVLK